MKNYINKIGGMIPNAISLGNEGLFIKDEDTAFFYGNNELTGWKKFWYKVKIKRMLWRKK